MNVRKNTCILSFVSAGMSLGFKLLTDFLVEGLLLNTLKDK